MPKDFLRLEGRLSFGAVGRLNVAIAHPFSHQVPWLEREAQVSIPETTLSASARVSQKVLRQKVCNVGATYCEQSFKGATAPLRGNYESYIRPSMASGFSSRYLSNPVFLGT